MAARQDLVRKNPWVSPAAILLTGFFFPTALALAQDRVGGYDFAYRLAGDGRARPVQVFDDGKQTFFQFRPGEPLPAIFADGPAGPRLLPPQVEGPYVKVAALADGFALRLGLGAATVAYIGSPRRREATEPLAPEPARRAPAPPASPPLQLAASRPVSGLPHELLWPSRPRITLEEGSYATPLKGDAIEWTTAPERARVIAIAFGKDRVALTPAAIKQIRSALAEASGSSRFELTAIDAVDHKPGLAEARARAVAAALTAAGAAPRNIVHKAAVSSSEPGAIQSAGVTLRVIEATTSAIGTLSALPQPQRPAPSVAEAPAPAPTPPATLVWAVRKSDGTLDRMLARWAGDAGWTLVWQDGPTVAITGDASLSRPDYIQAADYALEQALGAGYRLRATAYRNQVLVISREE